MRRPGQRTLAERVGLLAGVGSLVTLAAVATLLVPETARARRELLDLQARAVAAHLDDELARALGTLARLPTQPHVALDDDDPAPESAALHAGRLALRGFDAVVLADRAGGAASDPRGVTLPAALDRARGERRPRSLFDEGRLWIVVPQGNGPMLAAARVDASAPAWRRMLDAVSEPGVSAHVEDGEGHTVLGHHGPEQTVAHARPLTVMPWTVELDADPDAPRTGAGLAALAVAGLVLAVGFAWGAARSVTQPLLRLESDADRVAAGDLTRRIEEPGGGAEVDALARSLEQMRSALAAALEASRRNAALLERRVLERTHELQELNRELREREAGRSRLLRRTITAQEDERKRLARELHDDTCQAIAALGIGLDMALAAPRAEETRARLRTLRPRADQLLEDLRRWIVALRPSVLDDLGLMPALRWFAERTLSPLGISVRCELEECHERLSPEAETALFRCVQEVLTNVARHSAAEHVLVQAACEGERLEVEVEDDGIGFDAGHDETPDPSGRGLGLLGLRERVELLGGTLRIDSSPGDGTRVRLSVPVARNTAQPAGAPGR